MEHDVAIKSRQKPFDVMGSWRFGDSKEMTAGRLVYDGPGKIMLHVIMPIEPRGVRTHASEDLRDVKQVSGVLETGEFAVLENMHRTSGWTVTGFCTVTAAMYRVSCMFAGDQISDTSWFDSIRVKFAGLREWLNQRPITQSGDGPGEEITFMYKPPKGPEIALEDGMTLQVHYPYTSPHYVIAADKFVIPQDVEIVLSFEDLVPLDELYDRAMRFVRLLMLATGIRMPPMSIRVCAGRCWTGLFGKYPDYDEEARIDPYTFGFLYTDVQDHFEEMIKCWFAFYEKHRIGLDLYFETLMEEHHMSPEIAFLRTAQSLEALHRADHPEDQGMKDRISDLLKIKYDVLGAGTSKEEFAKNTATTRHYHAHGYIEEYEGKKQTGKNLIGMTLQLKFLMFAHMIDALAMPDALKKKMMDWECGRQPVKLSLALVRHGMSPSE